MDDVETEMSPLQDNKATPTHVVSVGPGSHRSSHRHAMAGHRVTQCLRTNLLTTLTVSGVVGGVILGFTMRALKTDSWTPREIVYVQFIGDLFLRMLKALIIPLLISSVVAAIGSLDLSLSYKIGARAIVYYLTTTVLAVIEGIILVCVIHPGRGGAAEEIKREGSSRNVTTVDTLLDLVRNMFPPNLVQATIQQICTEIYTNKSVAEIKNLYGWEMKNEFTDGTNVLGLVAFAIVLGIAIGKMGKQGKPLLDFFESLGTAMMNITNWVIWVSPIGVLFLVASKLLEMKDFSVLVGQLGMYFMTVLIGLLVHGFILLPCIYTLATKKLPFRFLANMGQALATAFGTASSSATLPVSMNCLEEFNGVDVRVSRFVMPIGATINMDGTALYEAVAAIFIAQVRNLSLGFGHIVAVSITATFASIGAAGIPQAGLVTMVMVLDTVGLPAQDVTLIIAVDWLLDRFRTLVNVVGDSLGAGIVNHLSKAELDKMSRQQSSGNGKSDGNVAEVHL
ncbi:excitatory amino acid transporter 1 [Frankliniella occidentalis]|uniref:Amino acid transporter n=1 Tax=Frankliniella occidentalis TaxID=133901 RepID=A0A9C6X6B2_FRAOC|nr:excitatory amino acid transporter 1 [Frankliniella occidentalis]